MSFTAKFPGTCVRCDDDVTPGQQVEFNFDRELQHVFCEEETNLDGKPEAVCPSCFITLPKTGRCEECFPDD